MRAVVQRVSEASVTSALPGGGEAHAAIGTGLMILLGVKAGDTAADAAWLARKCAELRIFADDAGRMNRGLLEMDGEALVVSQFTLYGDVSRGNRPSFDGAMPPAEAEAVYDAFVREARGAIGVETGRFRADMRVSSENVGPVTIGLDSQRT